MTHRRSRLLFVDAARLGEVLGIDRLGRSYAVRTASDPYSAILDARSGPLDLVVLTLASLGAREQEILAGMRDAANGAPLLVLLPQSSRASEIEARARGASSVLSVPCYFEDLVHAVETAIRRAASPGPSPLAPLSEVAGSLAEAQGDLPTLSERMLRAALERTTATRGSLFVLEEDGGAVYRCAAAVGVSSELVKAAHVRRGEGILGRVVERGEPLLVADVDHADLPRAKEPRSYRTVSFVSMPVRTADTVLAVLSIADREDGAAFSEADLRSLADIASLAAPYVETARHVKRIESLSTIDPLTGLFNRRHFDRCLEAETIRARRYGRNLTLVLLDIDDFKRYNDRFGYLAGDELLKKVAKILEESFRQVDVVTRWGGEEFAVLLPETGKPQASDVAGSAPIHFADRVRRAIEQYPFPHREELPSGCVSVSGGLATFPTDTSDPRELVALANRALRKAKESGKNRICLT
jgi:diguanylate cyclase (GGDEF)-like protein